MMFLNSGFLKFFLDLVCAFCQILLLQSVALRVVGSLFCEEVARLKIEVSTESFNSAVKAKRQDGTTAVQVVLICR